MQWPIFSSASILRHSHSWLCSWVFLFLVLSSRPEWPIFFSAPQFGASAMKRRDHGNTSTHSRPLRVAKFFGVRPASSVAEGWINRRFCKFNLTAKTNPRLQPPIFLYFIHVIIQNPTPVLMNHATRVILNACENARKLSTFALQIIANSYTWSVTFRSISSGLTFAIASK